MESIIKFASEFYEIVSLIEFLAYFVGVVISFNALSSLVHMSKYENQQTGHSPAMVVGKFVVASFFIAFGFFVNMISQSIGFGSVNSLSYGGSGGSGQFGALIKALFTIISAFGLFTMFRGLLVFHDLTRGKAQKTAKNAFIMIFFGALLFQIDKAILLLGNSFGFTATLQSFGVI